jgi:hypothetical protein
MKRFKEKEVRQQLSKFVRDGGQLEARREDAGSWCFDEDNPWWYFAIIPFPVYRHGMYIKAILLWEDGDSEDEAFVQIVSRHEEVPL